jgi:hypothetical protein
MTAEQIFTQMFTIAPIETKEIYDEINRTTKQPKVGAYIVAGLTKDLPPELYKSLIRNNENRCYPSRHSMDPKVPLFQKQDRGVVRPSQVLAKSLRHSLQEVVPPRPLVAIVLGPLATRMYLRLLLRVQAPLLLKLLNQVTILAL